MAAEHSLADVEYLRTLSTKQLVDLHARVRRSHDELQAYLAAMQTVFDEREGQQVDGG